MKSNRIIAILLTLSILLTLAGCAASGAGSAATTENDGVFDEKDLLALLDEAGRILAKEDTIVIENPNMYVRQFVRSNSDIFGDYAIWEENKLTLICEKVNSDRLHYMKYCVFIHILTTTYEDAVCDWHYNYTLSTGAAKQHVIFFCPSYKEEGFDTPLDCLKASKGKEFAEKNNYFYIDYGYGQCIFEYGLSTLSGIMRYDYMPGDYAK